MIKSIHMNKRSEHETHNKYPSPESSITLKKHISKRMINRPTIRELYKAKEYKQLIKEA